MKKLFFFFCFFPLFLQAQENTFIRGGNNNQMHADSLPERKSSVMILPFGSKMYMSEADRQLCVRNNLSFDALLIKMQAMLCEQVAFCVNDFKPSYSFFHPEIDTFNKEMHFVYSSLNYVYRVLEKQEAPKTDSSKSIGKIPVRFNPAHRKETTTPAKENGIHNGQVVAESNEAEKFMDCDIVNKNLLNELSSYHNAEFFVFLNQLDILYHSGNASEFRIKAHYSCFHLDGRKINAGAAIVFMPASELDLTVIRNSYFYPLAKDIANAIRSKIIL